MRARWIDPALVVWKKEKGARGQRLGESKMKRGLARGALSERRRQRLQVHACESRAGLLRGWPKRTPGSRQSLTRAASIILRGPNLRLGEKIYTSSQRKHSTLLSSCAKWVARRWCRFLPRARSRSLEAKECACGARDRARTNPAPPQPKKPAPLSRAVEKSQLTLRS